MCKFLCCPYPHKYTPCIHFCQDISLLYLLHYSVNLKHICSRVHNISLSYLLFESSICFFKRPFYRTHRFVLLSLAAKARSVLTVGLSAKFLGHTAFTM